MIQIDWDPIKLLQKFHIGFIGTATTARGIREFNGIISEQELYFFNDTDEQDSVYSTMHQHPFPSEYLKRDPQLHAGRIRQ